MLTERNVGNYEDGEDRGNLSPLVSRETLLNFRTMGYWRLIVKFITFDVDWSSKLREMASRVRGQADQAASGRCDRIGSSVCSTTVYQSMEESRAAQHNDVVYHWDNDS